MANAFIKATKVVSTALGVLERETILPQLVWRDAAGDFAGVYNDTVTIRVRAYIEDALADEISGATYALTETFSEAAPLHSVLSARRKLNDCYVPASGRALVVGSEIEQIILEDLASRPVAAPAEQNALTDATISTNYGGFRVVLANGIAPDECYAIHKTAFVLSGRAPVVPAGVPWGASMSNGGFAIRVIKDYDPLYIRDRCIGSSWIGCNTVLDDGDVNSDGQFVPEDGSGSGTPILVRAVKLTLGS